MHLSSKRPGNNFFVFVIILSGGLIAIILPHAIAECLTLMGGPVAAEAVRRMYDKKQKAKHVASTHIRKDQHVNKKVRIVSKETEVM